MIFRDTEDPLFFRLPGLEGSDLYYKLVDQIIRKDLGANEELVRFVGGYDVNIFTYAHIDFSHIRNSSTTLKLFISLLESILQGPKTTYFDTIETFLSQLKLLHKSMLQKV